MFSQLVAKVKIKRISNDKVKNLFYVKLKTLKLSTI